MKLYVFLFFETVNCAPRNPSRSKVVMGTSLGSQSKLPEVDLSQKTIIVTGANTGMFHSIYFFSFPNVLVYIISVDY